MQWPRSRARKNGASPQPNTGNQLPGHRSRGRATMPTTTPPASERRAAAAGRCTPRHSRGTLKDGRGRPEPCGARSAQRQGRPTPSIEQLLARQLLDAQSSSLPRSEGPETPNLLTFHLTPKAAGRKTSVTARILGFYNQSLLSSRSSVRITQGAFQSRAGFEPNALPSLSFILTGSAGPGALPCTAGTPRRGSLSHLSRQALGLEGEVDEAGAGDHGLQAELHKARVRPLSVRRIEIKRRELTS